MIRHCLVDCSHSDICNIFSTLEPARTISRQYRKKSVSISNVTMPEMYFYEEGGVVVGTGACTEICRLYLDGGTRQ